MGCVCIINHVLLREIVPGTTPIARGYSDDSPNMFALLVRPGDSGLLVRDRGFPRGLGGLRLYLPIVWRGRGIGAGRSEGGVRKFLWSCKVVKVYGSLFVLDGGFQYALAGWFGWAGRQI